MNFDRILVTGGSGFIGTNLAESLAKTAASFCNLDLAPPKIEAHRPAWIPCDILDASRVRDCFSDFRPDAVIHLAARTDCEESTTVEKGYRTNTEGTRSVVQAVRHCPSVQRFLHVSSQFVCRPGHTPRNETDFDPETVYGSSKAIGETIVREAGLTCPWTIVRPTNIWGPWHPRYPFEVWRVIRRGLYLHPAGPPVVRSYGYVGNLLWQLGRILELAPEATAGRVLYLGDRPADIRAWVDAFSIALIGRPVRRVPRALMRAASAAGDVISLLQGKPFLLTSSRFRSMTTDYIPPIEPTFELLGEPPHSLAEGVQTTARWLAETFPGLYSARR